MQEGALPQRGWTGARKVPMANRNYFLVGACEDGECLAASLGGAWSSGPARPPPLTTALPSWSTSGDAMSGEKSGLPMAPPRPDPAPGECFRCLKSPIRPA